MSTINALVQAPQTGGHVDLFRFDATSVGGSVYYFVQSRLQAGGVVFGGITYQPSDIEFTGLEVSGTGALPQPRLKIANTDGVIQSVINTFGDLCGCTLRRVRTFEKYLDGKPEADPTAYFGPEIFRVERKTSETPLSVEWELSTSIDQEGKQLPGRVVVRDTCLWRYRRWTGSAWDYSEAQCPYVGTQAYDANNNPVADPALDRPARNLSCCKTRFGDNAALPFGGFPGVARARQ
jgi:lambda family phage minor tail protein L